MPYSEIGDCGGVVDGHCIVDRFLKLQTALVCRFFVLRYLRAYQEGAPGIAAGIDGPIAERYPCWTCGGPMAYRPWMKPASERTSYRAFAVCARCNQAYEFQALCLEDIMHHQMALSMRHETDQHDTRPGCTGELAYATAGFWDDVSWTVYHCRGCGQLIATVGGGRHWWNYVLSDESTRRLFPYGIEEQRTP